MLDILLSIMCPTKSSGFNYTSKDYAIDIICSVCFLPLVDPIIRECECGDNLACRDCHQGKGDDCHKCSSRVISRELDKYFKKHLEKKLESLEISCQHRCGHTITRGDIDYHNDKCTKFPCHCEYYDAGCRKKIAREDLAKHIVECPFKPFTDKFLEIDNAIQNNNQRLDRLNGLDDKVLEYSDKIEQLEHNLSSLCDDYSQHLEYVDEIGKEIDNKLMKEIEDLKQTNRNLTTKFEILYEKFKELESRIN